MSKDEYLITDTPLKALTVFAMPMILGSFFQQIYNMADSIIVGQFVGSSALAAVGACAALTNVFICVALGAGVGAGVLVSRYFGAREYGKMKTIVSTSLISFLLLSIILGVFGFAFSHAMMSGLQTPADILDDAVLYLRVYFVGFPFLFMYNILSTMFTSIGESKIPLGLLIFSSILNILMDLWMVAGLGLGVFGAAIATLIAQGISAVFSFLIFFARMQQYKSPFNKFDRQELYSMLRIAVPSVLQQSTVSIGKKLIVQDASGRQAAAVQHVPFSLPCTYALTIGGREYDLTRNFAFFSRSYSLDELGWEIEGDFMSLDYEITQNGRRVAAISRAFLTLGDRYALEVFDPQDALIALCTVLAIDCCAEEHSR